MLKTYKPGSNVTLMNTLFFRRKEEKEFKEYLTLVYKDCDTGLKYQETIEDPDYEYYIVKDDRRVDYNRLFVEKEDVVPVTVKYRNLEKDIAKRIGASEFFYTNIANGNRMENKKLHLHPDVFNSDMNIEDHYRFRFSKLYKNDPCPITKSFFDIEEDTINMEKDFPEPGECPINAISLILQEQQIIYVFLLRNKNNPQIEEFEQTVIDGSIFPELKEFVINAVGGIAAYNKYKMNFEYDFLFYDEENEIGLIKDLFNAINAYKPDFTLAWNMGFDMVHIMARIRKLGYDPADIICHPDFNHRIAEYFVDERNLNSTAERGDFALISSYTVYMCQMIQFESRRKGQAKFPSNKLDDIGEAVAKVKKLDYRHITTSISELPYKSYKTFVFYNIMDTIVQYCIEFMTEDANYIFAKCVVNNTRYSKGHRQTVYLTNRGAKEFYNEGFIIGNNANKFNPPPTEKFPGAFVADPLRLNNHSRLKIYGRAVDIFDNAIDLDYSALYPSMIRQFNMAAHTQIGMVKIDQPVHYKENRRNWDTWTRASAYMEDFQSHMWLEFCSRWLNLPDYETLYHEIEDFFTTKMRATEGLRYYNREGYVIGIIDQPKNGYVDGIIFDDTRRQVVESNFVSQPLLDKWEAWRENAIAYPNQQF